MNARVLMDSPASSMAGRPKGTPPLRLAAALAVLAAAVGIPGPAGGQTAEAVEILSPKADALHTSGALTVRVRTRGEHTAFQAHLRGSTFAEVTDRFRSPRRGVWTAKFRLGHELVLGRNHLFVQVQRPSGEVDVQAVHFTAARRARGLLGLGVRFGNQGAPLTVRARAPHADGVRATLNGRDAGDLFERDAAGRWVARLAANDGLRFGRNRLTVTAFTEQGEYERIQRTVRIERTSPLVGAGRDTTTRTGTRVRLDGSSTRASGRGGPLALAWQIASRPEGSTATLRGASSARPSLRPDVPGDYTIRLQVSEARSEAATDTVTVTAQPNALPAGIPVTTMVSFTTPGVLIGGQFFAMEQPGWLQMLVLDRATALPSQSFATPNQSYPGTDQGMSDLASDVAKLSPTNDLAILSASGQPAALSTSASSTLSGVVNTLGGILQPGTGSVADLASGQWSLIGIPGLPPGAAYQNIGLQLDTDVIAGSLTGFFQQDTSSNFTFTWPPTFLPFDTQATGTGATQNVIAVGSETYTSAQVPSGQSAFHVVWLDSGSLALQGQYTAVASETGCDSSGPLLCLSDLARSLESIVESQRPALLLVATIGMPAFSSGDQVAWAFVAQTLNSMGAQPFVLLGLDGTGDYSLVGIQGLLQLEGPNSGTELSQVVTGSPTARLVGLLQRNRQSNWMAGPNGSPGPGIDPTVFQPSLQQILARRDEPFQPFTGPAQAAEQYIACKLTLPIDPQYGIRANYWQNDSITWSAKQNDLISYTKCDESDPCYAKGCEDAFLEVQQTLIAEFGDVATVRNYLFTNGGGGALWGVFNSAFIDGSVGFTAISGNILSLYALPPPQPPQGGNSSQLMEALTTIASGAAGPIPVAGSFISGAFNISRGVVMLMDYLDNDSEGVPALDTRAFGADLTEWGSALANAWTASVGSLGLAANLLLSDAGRLSAAAARVSVAGTDAVCSNNLSIECSSSADCGGAECLPPGWGWGLSDGSGTNVTNTITRSIAQYLWSTMLPVPVRVVPCGSEFPDDLDPGPPYPDLLRFSWLDARWVVLDGFLAYGVTDVYAILLSATSEQPGWAVPAATLEQLFDPDQVGLQKPYFYAEAWMDGSTPVTPGFVYGWGEGAQYGCLCWPPPPDQCSETAAQRSPG